MSSNIQFHPSQLDPRKIPVVSKDNALKVPPIAKMKFGEEFNPRERSFISLKSIKEMTPKERDEALVKACSLGLIDVVEALLKQPGVDVNRMNAEGELPLVKACEFNGNKTTQLKLLEALLSHGANVTLRDKKGSKNALELLCAFGDSSIEQFELIIKKDPLSTQYLGLVLVGAIAMNHYKLANFLLSSISNVNGELKGKNALMHLMEKNEKLTDETRNLAKRLLEKGAKILTEHHSALRPALDQRSVEKIMLLLNIDEASAKKMIDQIPDRVLLTHVNSFKGHYECENDWMIRQYVTAALKQMPEELCRLISADHKKELIEAFELTNNNLSQINEVVSSIQQGKLTILTAGHEGHTAYVVFCNGYMAICNRGSGKLEGRNTIDAFKIDPSLMTEAMIREGFELKSKGSELFTSKIYQELPARLSPTGKPIKDTLCGQLEWLSQKPQKANNCAYVSPKLAIRVATAMQKIDGAALSKTDVKNARQFSKNFSAHARLDALNSAYQTGIHDEMTNSAYEKAMKHAKKASRVPLERYYKFVEEKRRQGSWIWKGVEMLKLAGQLINPSLSKVLSY